MALSSKHVSEFQADVLNHGHSIHALLSINLIDTPEALIDAQKTLESGVHFADVFRTIAKKLINEKVLPDMMQEAGVFWDQLPEVTGAVTEFESSIFVPDDALIYTNMKGRILWSRRHIEIVAHSPDIVDPAVFIKANRNHIVELAAEGALADLRGMPKELFKPNGELAYVN